MGGLGGAGSLRQNWVLGERGKARVEAEGLAGGGAQILGV